MTDVIEPVEEGSRERTDMTEGLTVERRDDGQLWARRAGEERPVWVRRCFPWSEPTRYVSLRDHDKNEFVLVTDARTLDPESRHALEAELAVAGFVLEIERILAVEDEIEIRVWEVSTRQGDRRFQTRLDDWPREVPGGGYLIRDVSGDLYYIEDAGALDKRSRDLLWAYVD